MAGTGQIKKIIVVGAGPSGLLLAIMLAKAGIQIQMIEAGNDLDKNPRAAHYGPSAVYEFTRAGIVDLINAKGFFPTGVCWRESDGTFVAGGHFAYDPKYPMVVLPLDQFNPILYEHLIGLPNAEVLFSHRAVGIEHGETEAKVIVQTPEGQKTMSADYVIGADGATSQIRRSLFGDQYPGETLPEQIIATNVYYDFIGKLGWWDTNFILHPTDWYMAAKITNDGLWRVTYGDVAGLTKEEYIARQPQRYREILPNSPEPEDYKLIAASPYKLQQRCAPSFRVGRFVLVADAAHLCNPFGGLGLTGGFADVGSLYDCLYGIHNGLADESILDKYSEIRIKLWREMIDPVSRMNFRRLWDDSVKGERDALFKMMNEVRENPDLVEKNEPDHHAIRHDFSQYYNKPVNSN